MKLYKFEVIEGHFVHNPGQKNYAIGPDFYYCAILKWSNDPSWLQFSQAKQGCVSVLESNLKHLQNKNNNCKSEITILEKIIDRLKNIDEDRDLAMYQSKVGKKII